MLKVRAPYTRRWRRRVGYSISWKPDSELELWPAGAKMADVLKALAVAKEVLFIIVRTRAALR